MAEVLNFENSKRPERVIEIPFSVRPEGVGPVESSTFEVLTHEQAAERLARESVFPVGGAR